jgi:predicted lipoprotein with Yx(FWY)xxD motif
VRLELASCILAGALVLAACGGDDDDDTEASGPGDTTEAADSGSGAPGAGAPVGPGPTDLGDVLVDADGMTVYAFTNDTDGVSTCTGSCAETWPPVTVDGEQLPDGLDAAVFGVSEPSDGVFQLTAGDQPLYTFSGDTAPGDANGQGVDGAWFVVGPDGRMIQDAGGAGDGSGATTTIAPTTTAPAGDVGGYDYDY